MKILFSPSEDKIFPSQRGVMSERVEGIYQRYFEFISSASEGEIAKAMGYSKLSEVAQALSHITQEPKLGKAIELYSGVAYDALDFPSLPQDSKQWLSKNTLIFSNLFGAVSAEELLPFYKLKQGEGFASFSTKEVYQKQESEIDESLEGEFVLDLRAEFYKKLYMPKSHHYSMEFYKNGKKVSHFGKYYRGIVLRELALNRGFEGIEERVREYGIQSEGIKNSKNCTTLTFCIL